MARCDFGIGFMVGSHHQASCRLNLWTSGNVVRWVAWTGISHPEHSQRLPRRWFSIHFVEVAGNNRRMEWRFAKGIGICRTKAVYLFFIIISNTSGLAG